MKTNYKLLRQLSFCLLALAVTVGVVRGQDLVYMTFDTDDQGFPCGGWDAEKSYSWEASLDGNNDPASGSLRVDVYFTNVNYTTLQTCKGVTDLTLYEKMKLDVYLDPTNTPNASGNFGTLQVRFRPGWAWPGDVMDSWTITNTGWSHLEGKIPVSATSASGVNFHWSTGFTNSLDQRTIWLDNIVFVASVAPPAPPTLSIRKTVPGLEIMTAGAPDYSRRNIATVSGLAPVLGWLNSSGAVTYSMTVNETVQDGSSGYAANILLCAGTDATINGSPDWNQPSGIFMEAIPNTNGTIDVTVRYKTNAPSSHGIRFAGDPTNGYPGLLIEKTNTGLKSLVGTWSLTLNGATVQLSGPGGLSGTGQLPTDALSWFGSGNNFWALFGAQPYTRNNRTISLSRVHIYGPGDFNGSVDQDFTTSTAIDSNVLEAKEEGSNGVILKPTNTLWRIWWDLPDTGLYLWSAPTVKSSDWHYSGLLALTQGTQRTVWTTNVSSSAGYFQLRNAGGPPYLLESFEGASPFPGAAPPYFNFEPSTAAGVTEGSYSLHVSYTNDMTWSWVSSEDYGSAAYAAWRSHSKLTFDLHRAAFTDGWNLEMAVAVDGTMGWNQAQVVNWVWLNAGAETTQTLSWNYGTVSGAAPATGTSFKLNLMLRGNGGDANGHCGDVYIDNIRFTD